MHVAFLAISIAAEVHACFALVGMSGAVLVCMLLVWPMLMLLAVVAMGSWPVHCSAVVSAGAYVHGCGCCCVVCLVFPAVFCVWCTCDVCASIIGSKVGMMKLSS